jgi:hypothetical protein
MPPHPADNSAQLFCSLDLDLIDFYCVDRLATDCTYTSHTLLKFHRLKSEALFYKLQVMNID